jgi:hypothetical protein
VLKLIQVIIIPKIKLYLMKYCYSSLLVVPGICAKEEEDFYVLNLCVYVYV